MSDSPLTHARKCLEEIAHASESEKGWGAHHVRGYIHKRALDALAVLASDLTPTLTAIRDELDRAVAEHDRYGRGRNFVDDMRFLLAAALLADTRAATEGSEMLKPRQPIGDDESRSLLQTMDGAKWANAFCRATGFPDEGWALTWFCNAIMAGYDEAERRSAPSAPTRETGWQVAEAVEILEEHPSVASWSITRITNPHHAVSPFGKGFGVTLVANGAELFVKANEQGLIEAVNEATRRLVERLAALPTPPRDERPQTAEYELSCGCFMRRTADGGLDQLTCSQHLGGEGRLIR